MPKNAILSAEGAGTMDIGLTQFECRQRPFLPQRRHLRHDGRGPGPGHRRRRRRAQPAGHPPLGRLGDRSRVGSLEIAVLRPAPGRRMRSEGSSHASSSFKPPPDRARCHPGRHCHRGDPSITPPGECRRRRDRRRPRSSRTAPPPKTAAQNGSISITTTIYGMKRRL